MKERDHDVWYLPQSITLESLLDAVASKFTFEVKEPQEGIFTYFDTFDWRLHRRGSHLQHSTDMWLLTQSDSQKTIELNNGPNPGQNIFSWDFPAGQLRTSLESALDVRALLPLATLKSAKTSIRVLNKDAKTVGILLFERHQVNGAEDILRTVKLQGIRGYDKQKQSIRNLLHSHGIVDQASPRDTFKEGLRKSTGRVPGDYNSKFFIQLDPDLTAKKAAIAIYNQLLATMQCNEEGILKDLDSEFLHDFRVAIRRTRSGLTQIKNVLPPEVTNHFKAEFAHLGNITGPTRDLDVYLLYEENYKSRLPPPLQTALHTFFTDLARRRGEEQKKLATALKGSRYKQIIHEWRQYLEEDGTAAADADMPVIDLARKTISRRYKKIMKEGMMITPATPDENLHRLRIQGKKLRYSLEFFTSLFPKNDMEKIIKQLKQLQNNLGTFNDLSVQQDMLHDYLDGLRPGSRKNFELATAIGGLLTNLYHEQHRVRENFFLTFNRFSSKKNVVLFNKLFNQQRQR